MNSNKGLSERYPCFCSGNPYQETTMNETIDIPSSSDEEEEKNKVERRSRKHPPVVRRRRHEKKKKTMPSSSNTSNGIDDEIKIVGFKKPNQSYQSVAAVTPDGGTNKAKSSDSSSSSGSDDDSSDGLRPPKTKKPRQLFPARRHTTKSKPTRPPPSDDEESDDEILKFESGFTNKEKVALKKTETSRQTLGTKSTAKTDESSAMPFASAPSKKPTATSGTTTAKEKTSRRQPEPVHNPYCKNRFANHHSSDDDSHDLSIIYGNPDLIPNPQDQIVPYPNLGGNQTYHPDIRPKYILAFWKYSQSLVYASYNLVKLDQFAKRINALALSKFPIRSFEEYCHRFASTTSNEKEIQKAIQASSVNAADIATNSNASGKYFSIAEACLVSILSVLESTAQNGSLSLDAMEENSLKSLLKEKSSWIFLSDLIPMIDRRLKSICPGTLTRPNDDDNGAAHFLEKSTRSAEYRQIEKLESQNEDTAYIKRHRQGGKVCFELTLLGYETANRIKQRSFPACPGHYRTSNLTQVESRYQGICLAVDKREGGGPQNQLHSICNKLDTLKMPFFVCTMNIGDYCFFAGSKLLPIIIERKSIEDVAESIFDGRWRKQKRKMYKGQFVFGYHHCRMAYIIEGKKETHQLTAGFVGQRHFNVTSEQFDKEIDRLESEGFDVLRTHSRQDSMVKLSHWATRVLKDFQQGKLEAKYSFEEFQREVEKIPYNTDFSRIAKDMVKSRLNDTPELKANSNQSNVSSSSFTKKAKVQTKLSFGLEKATSTVQIKPPPNKIKTTENQYQGWTVTQLKEECAKYGLPKTGKKADLIDRLNGPRPPKILLERKARGYYVPSRYNTCATALLVGLWLEQRKNEVDWKGLTKDELYPLAESLDISKDPFSGVTTGVFKYDGWSSMSDLKGGEIPLVVLKRGYFKLTTHCEVAGLSLAESLHGWCHQHGVCSCRELGYTAL